MVYLHVFETHATMSKECLLLYSEEAWLISLVGVVDASTSGPPLIPGPREFRPEISQLTSLFFLFGSIAPGQMFLG